MSPSIASLLCGLDSLFIGVAVGTNSPSRRWIWIAAALGMADSVAADLGERSGAVWPAWIPAFAPAILVIYAFGALLAAPWMRELLTRPLGMAVLPLALSLDNFLGAASFPTEGATARAATMGAASFLLAGIGCALGGAVNRRRPGLARLFASSAALAAAAAMSLA